MGCGSSKAVPVREPTPAPTVEQPSQPPTSFPEKAIEEVEPVETQSEPNLEPETNEEPELTPVNDDPQRRSSRVTSNDSGLEEDNFAPEIPPPNDNTETVPPVAPVEEPKPSVDDEEPDGTRTHSVSSPVFVGSKLENSECPKREASAIPDNDQSVIVHCVDREREEVTDLGGTIEADDGLDMGNENEEWNNDDTEAATSAQDIPSLPNDNEEDTLGSGSGSLVIEGTAIEQSKESSPPAVQPTPLTPVEQNEETEEKPPLQRNLTYKREKSAFNRPNSAQSRPQSSFQRPTSSNSVKLLSNVMTEDAVIVSEQRPASQTSRKSVQSLVPPIAENEESQIKATAPENETKLSDLPLSTKSTQSMSRPTSKTSIRSAKCEPPELPLAEQELVQQMQTSRPPSQVSLETKTKNEEVQQMKTQEAVTSRPSSKTSRTSVSGTTNPHPVAEVTQTSSRAPSVASERPISKTSQASKRVGSAVSQRSSGSLRVPDLDTAETSGTNMTHAERSASSLEDLEMLQHVMEGTLEGKPGGSDEMDCTEEAETGEPDSEESNKISKPAVLCESQNLPDIQQENPKVDENPTKEEDAQSEMGLDDVQTNKLLDTFSTKNLESSMKMNDTGNEADDDAKIETDVAKSPQEDQEEHISM